MTLAGVVELRNQPALIKAATGACMVTSEDIRNEDPQTADHSARITWSLQSPDQNALAIMPMIAMNNTVQTKWIAGEGQPDEDRYDDADIQFIVNSWVGTFVVDNP